MKYKNLILSVVTLCATALSAVADTTPPGLGTVTNLPPVVTAAASSNTTSYIDIYADSGLALSWKFNVSAGTSNAAVLLYPSVDRTNYDNIPWVLLRPATGATDYVATTNWSAAQLRGYARFKVGGMTNQNNGTLTNKGIVFRRPTP